VTFTQAFKYLGILATSNLDDFAEVVARIRAATAAFKRGELRLAQGTALRLCQAGPQKKTYEGLVIGLVLYGSESWSLTQDLKRRLQTRTTVSEPQPMWQCIRIRDTTLFQQSRMFFVSFRIISY
jgi:hypothetical protein